MTNELKLTVPEDCGNAPRKLVLRDFNTALVTKDYTFILDTIADDITWTIVGDETVRGQEAFIRKLDELHQDQAQELVINYIITHGYTASANGKVIGHEQSYDFCHVYRFAGASKTAKMKEITSYLIRSDLYSI